MAAARGDGGISMAGDVKEMPLEQSSWRGETGIEIAKMVGNNKKWCINLSKLFRIAENPAFGRGWEKEECGSHSQSAREREREREGTSKTLTSVQKKGDEGSNSNKN